MSDPDYATLLKAFEGYDAALARAEAAEQALETAEYNHDLDIIFLGNRLTARAEAAEKNFQELANERFDISWNRVHAEARVRELEAALRELIGHFEIGAVMPEATGKAYCPPMDADFLKRARSLLAQDQGETP